MKKTYYKPTITVDALAKTDVLCDSENAYQSLSGLDKNINGKSMMDMIGDGSLWSDD